MQGETLVLENGRILTSEGFAATVVIRDKRIAGLDASPSGAARRIDLGGRLVVPGFIDNHVHFCTGGFQLGQVQLRTATSPVEFARRLADRAASSPRGHWITGGGWDDQRWTPAVLPDRRWVDDATREHPLFVTRLDMHMALANSLALQLAEITSQTPDPPGGTIVRDSRGEPTGALKDTAMRLVDRVIPPPSIEMRCEAIRAGLREAARFGVTSFCDMGMSDEAFDDFRAYQRLEREGLLSARVRMYLPISSWQRLKDAGVEKNFGSSRLRVGGLKGFADGSLGSSTAAFHEPFEGEPDNCGLLMEPLRDGSLAKWVREADAHELQIALHAIGDRANDAVLAIFESLPESGKRRLRVEHAQHLDDDLIRRFARSGVIASMQPYHAIDDGRWAESRIGPRRAARAYPFRSLLDAGAFVTFGSDWPVAPLNPILGLFAAVTRRTIDGSNPDGWVPTEKITVSEALRLYTENNAWAMFSEQEVGRIVPGMRADLAVLSEDILEIPPEELENVRVEMTIFDGEVIYEN